MGFYSLGLSQSEWCSGLVDAPIGESSSSFDAAANRASGDNRSDVVAAERSGQYFVSRRALF